MSLLLYEKHVLVTKLSDDEVLEKLAKYIGQQHFVKEFLFGSAPYFGQIAGNFFYASRFTKFQRRVMPVMLGTIRSTLKGCEIDLLIGTDNCKKSTAVIYAVLFGIPLLVILAFMIWGLIIGQDYSFLVFFLILVAGIYLAQWINFKIEAATYKFDFCQLLHGDIDE